MDSKISIDDIYIGLERKEEYSEFLEEYELWEEHVLLEKTKYVFNLFDKTIQVYENIENKDKLYIDKDGSVINSKDELTQEERYHQILSIISLKDLLKKYEEESRDDSQYRRYIMPIYKRVVEVLKDKESIDVPELKKIFGNINDIHSYVFKLIDEDEYEDLFGCRTYDFNKGCRIRQ